MSKKNDGGQAFPLSYPNGYSSNGMTLRDVFAMAALQGFCALDKWGLEACKRRAEAAWMQADEMIKMRDKE